MSRYARQMIMPEVGGFGQASLGAGRVLVVGAGGLAAPVLPLLTGAGVGNVTVVDGDTVSMSNLHRQTFFTEADIGRNKAVAAAERCYALNSETYVDAEPYPLTPANARDLMAGYDVVLDCADSYAVSYTLSDICLEMKMPLISASVLGMGGYVGGFCDGAPSLRALFPDAPDSGASCATAGVLGPIVGMIGAMQAQMALAVLLGLDPDPLGQMVRLDGQSYRFSSFRFDGAPEPDDAFRFVAAQDLTDADHIIELRDEAAPLHPNALRQSADGLVHDLPPADTRLALCCATGLRAWRAAEQIRNTWPGEIVLVAASSS